MNDTSPEMTEKMNELFQQKTPLERLQMGFSMLHTSKSLIIQSILRDHPDISQADLRAEFFIRFYGDDYPSQERKFIAEYLKNCTETNASLTL